MRDIIKLVIVLTLISTAAGLLLAWTNKVTSGPILAAQAQERNEALRRVLPAFDNQPARTTNVVIEGGRTSVFYVARQQGRFVGAAFETTSDKGYGGEIRLLVGVTADNTLYGFEVLSHRETPGLGSKITEPAFKNQFRGRPLSDTRWAVKKDGGPFDAITGATISSRAVLEAIRSGLEVYRRHSAAIARTGAEVGRGP